MLVGFCLVEILKNWLLKIIHATAFYYRTKYLLLLHLTLTLTEPCIWRINGFLLTIISGKGNTALLRIFDTKSSGLSRTPQPELRPTTHFYCIANYAITRKGKQYFFFLESVNFCLFCIIHYGIVLLVNMQRQFDIILDMEIMSNL